MVCWFFAVRGSNPGRGCVCVCIASGTHLHVASCMLHLQHLRRAAGGSHLLLERWENVLWPPPCRTSEATLCCLWWGTRINSPSCSDLSILEGQCICSFTSWNQWHPQTPTYPSWSNILYIKVTFFAHAFQQKMNNRNTNMVLSNVKYITARICRSLMTTNCSTQKYKLFLKFDKNAVQPILSWVFRIKYRVRN